MSVDLVQISVSMIPIKKDCIHTVKTGSPIESPALLADKYFLLQIVTGKVLVSWKMGKVLEATHMTDCRCLTLTVIKHWNLASGSPRHYWNANLACVTLILDVD